MSFLNIIHDDNPTAINADNVMSVSYKEAVRQLSIEFTNGKVITLLGDEAERVWEMFSYELEPEEEVEEDEFEEIYEEIAAIENQLKNDAITNDREIWNLQRTVESLDQRWDSKKKKELGGKLKEVRKRVEELFNEVEAASEIHKIEEALSAPIMNTQASKSILRTLDDAEKLLKKRKSFTDEVQQKIRTAKERIAWHRAKKKLDDANVADAGGSSSRRDKYRREAEALLKQDWAIIFPNEQPPNVSS